MVFLRSLWLLWCGETFPPVGMWILSTCLRSYHPLACPFLEFLSPYSQIVFSQADAGQKPWAVPCEQLILSFLTVPVLHECQHRPPESGLCPLCSVRTRALPLLHSQGHNLEATTCRDNYGVLPSYFPSIRDHRPALLTCNEKKLWCHRLYYVIIHCLWTEVNACQYGFDVVPGLIKFACMCVRACMRMCVCAHVHASIHMGMSVYVFRYLWRPQVRCHSSVTTCFAFGHFLMAWNLPNRLRWLTSEPQAATVSTSSLWEL